MVGPIGAKFLRNWTILMLLVTSFLVLTALLPFSRKVELIFFAGICLSFGSLMTYTE